MTELTFDHMPIGGLLPFNPDKVPQGWIPLEGQTLWREDNEELHENIAMLKGLWEILGGSVGDKAIICPDLTADEVCKFSFGLSFKNTIPMVLAIKAEDSES
jgi:hypothetical protein